MKTLGKHRRQRRLKSATRCPPRATIIDALGTSSFPDSLRALLNKIGITLQISFTDFQESGSMGLGPLFSDLNFSPRFQMSDLFIIKKIQALQNSELESRRPF